MLTGKIKAIAMDVDGVLTDGAFWWDQQEQEFKRFCHADLTGIALAKKAGIYIALISGDSSPSGQAIVNRYARKMNISSIYTGCHDKGKAIIEFAEELHLALSEICYIGDDIIDLPAMKLIGLSAAPPDAHHTVLSTVDYVTEKAGGSGAVREVIDMILAMKNKTA